MIKKIKKKRQRLEEEKNTLNVKTTMNRTFVSIMKLKIDYLSKITQ